MSLPRLDAKGQPVPQNPSNPKEIEDPGSKVDRYDIVSKSGGGFVLKSHTGKVLGHHKTEASAKAQEAAINISKARAAGHHIPTQDDHYRLAERASNITQKYSDKTAGT